MPEKDGKEITPDEYLESMLELKPGNNTEVVRFNKPREGIMKYFPCRKLFTFDRPGDRDQMQMLDKVHIDNLSKSFKEDTETFLLYMLEQKPKVLLHSKPVTGHMFTTLVDNYVSAISKGVVPDVDDAITIMANIENERLKNILVQTFRNQLNNVKLPVHKTTVLEQLYQNRQKEILAEFRKEAVFNVEKVEKEIVDELDKMWIEKKKENLQKVKEDCVIELNKIYKQHVGEPDQYNKVGGYREYKRKMVHVRQSYLNAMAETDGITVKEVMNEFIIKEAHREQIILTSDMEMSEKERKKEISRIVEDNMKAQRDLQIAHQQQMQDQKLLYEKHTQEVKQQRIKDEKKQEEKYNYMINLWNKENEASRLLIEGMKTENAAEKASLLSQLNIITSQLNAMTISSSQTNSENKSLKSKLDTITSQLNEMESSFSQTNTENTSLKSQLDAIKNKLYEIESISFQTYTENTNLKSQLDTKTSELNEMQSSSSQTNTENTDLKSQIDTIKRQLNEIQSSQANKKSSCLIS